MIRNPLTVANLFNEHFCDVCKSVDSNTNSIIDSTPILYSIFNH